MSEIVITPTPPYYAVIFTSHRTEGDHGYAEIAVRMVELASQQPGFLGAESARESVGITESEQAISRVLATCSQKCSFSCSPSSW